MVSGTVAEQFLYEIGNPAEYSTRWYVILQKSLLTIEDRVHVSGHLVHHQLTNTKCLQPLWMVIVSMVHWLLQRFRFIW